MIKSRKKGNRKEVKVDKYEGHDVLCEWIMSHDSCEEASNNIGVCSGTISNWSTGFRKPSLQMCMRIESVTNGKVKASSIRPDLLKKWT